MKKLLLFASIVMIVGEGCYKPKDKGPAENYLTRTSWKIINHLKYPVDSGASCHVAQLLVFNDDSTGYYYYPTACNPGDADTLRFRWYVSGDNKNLYYSNIGGNPSAVDVMAISTYDQSTLTLHGNAFYERYLDGFFVATK